MVIRVIVPRSPAVIGASYQTVTLFPTVSCDRSTVEESMYVCSPLGVLITTSSPLVETTVPVTEVDVG